MDSSKIEADPRDTTHWPRGVWALPPTYRLGALDHDKYAKVGGAENFLLKFRKAAVDRSFMPRISEASL